MLRLREQLAKWERDEPVDNFVNIPSLGKLERHLLRDFLKIVKELKSFISYHFKLSYGVMRSDARALVFASELRGFSDSCDFCRVRYHLQPFKGR